MLFASESGFDESRLGIVLGIAALGLVAFGVWVVIYGAFDTSRRLTKKDTRKDAVEGIKEGAKTTGAIAGGMVSYYLLLFGGIFFLLVIANALGLD